MQRIAWRVMTPTEGTDPSSLSETRGSEVTCVVPRGTERAGHACVAPRTSSGPRARQVVPLGRSIKIRRAEAVHLQGQPPVLVCPTRVLPYWEGRGRALLGGEG